MLKRIRRTIILLAIFSATGYGIFWMATNAGKLQSIVEGRNRTKTSSTPARKERIPGAKPLEEGLFRTSDGRASPGLIKRRLDTVQFIQRNLARVSGNYPRDENPEDLFDGKRATSVVFPDAKNAVIQIDYTQEPQYITGIQFLTGGKNSGKWHLEAIIETRDNLGNVSQRREYLLRDRTFAPGLLNAEDFSQPVSCRALRLILEGGKEDLPLSVVMMDVHGIVRIGRVAITAEERQIRLNRTTTCRIQVTDTNGIVLDDIGDISWKSSNPVIAQVKDDGKVTAYREGEANIFAEVYGMRSNPLPLVVFTPKDSPTGIVASPMNTKIYLEWVRTQSKYLSHYRVYRRTDKGEYTSRHIGKSFQNSFTDEGLMPGKTYFYRVEAFDLEGKRISSPSEEIAVTTLEDRGMYSKLPKTDILVLLYREGLSDYQVAQRIRGLDEAKLFYYRNSKGRLLFDMQYYEIHTLPPKTADPDPDHPTMAYIAADCLKRGVEHGQFDIIYATGRGLCGCWGGFGILGGLGAFGDAANVPYPTRDREIDLAMIWSFAHECHHAFDGVCDISGPEPMLGCHFYDNFPLRKNQKLDCGSHYDGIAEIIRTYPHYNLREPFKQEIEFLDFDGDMFPDYDPRFPMDEARFGSSPMSKDTDGDGLSDLEEFFAGRFTGTDPNNVDTDGDGIIDGQDKYPLYNVSEAIPYYPGGHKIDGILEPGWSRFSDGVIFSHDEGLKVRTYMNYDENFLYVAFESNRKLKAFIEIDGSGEDGRWASPYKFAGSDNKDGKTSRSDSYVEDCAFVVEYGKNYVMFNGERMGFDTEKEKSRTLGRGSQVREAVVASGTRNLKNTNSYSYIMEVRIPQKLPPGANYTYFPDNAKVIDGLQLKPGNVFGINFYVGDKDKYGDSQFSGMWGNVFETYHFVDVTLSDDSDLDGDGLNAYQEAKLGTDPMMADTDGDGIIDSRDAHPTVNLMQNR